MRSDKVYAVILAAGSGKRMGADVTKQRMILCGRSVIYRTVSAFYGCDLVDGIVVVGRADEQDYLVSELADFSAKINSIIVGGECRLDSAAAGFRALPTDATIVAVHDGARPLITADAIEKVVTAAIECGAATDAACVYDTVKKVDAAGIVTETLDRNTLVLARTPQVFRTDIYARALENAPICEGITDDNMMVEAIGVPVRAVLTDCENPKITTMNDLRYAEFLLNARKEENV